MDLKTLMKQALDERGVALGKPPPIPCRGYEINTPDAHEYDCAYEHAGKFGCEDCIVNGGPYDPRTGRRYKGKKQ